MFGSATQVGLIQVLAPKENMDAYLLTWKPSEWGYDHLLEFIKEFEPPPIPRTV